MSHFIPERLHGRLNSDSSMDETPLIPSPSLKNTYLAAVSAFLYIVVMGMVSSYSAPATADMTLPGSRLKDITKNEITWIASLPMFSGAIGNCLSGYISHRFGRKTVLMLLSVSLVSSWLVIAYANVVSVIYVGRLMSGFCAGVSSVAVSAYVVEIAPTHVRGRLTAGFQVAYSVGVFAIMSTGIFLRWSWLAIFAAIVATSAVCTMSIMPESPPWLIRHSKYAEALKALRFLKGRNSNTKKELKDITDNLEQEEEDVSFKQILDPVLYKPMAIAVTLMFFQQTSGIAALMGYTVDIFRSTGSSVNPGIASAVVAAVQVLMTFTSSMLMDRTGRKKLFITSSISVSISLTILGIYSYISSINDINLRLYGWIPLVSFIAYIVFYSLGMGPVPFVMTPEMVPIRYRSPTIAAANLTCSFFGFVITKIFEDMKSFLGLYGVYWTYASASIASAAFGYFVLPETKGLSLTDIHRSFSSTINK